MTPFSLSVVIPAYNEQATLKGVFEEIKLAVSALGIEYEIILCDDASTDQTKSIIETIVTTNPHVRAIYHSNNLGIFATFEELYKSATKEFVLLMPADGQWSPDFLPKAMSCAKNNDIVVIARRSKQYPLWRKINSWSFNHLVKWAFGVDLYDIGSVKLMRRKIILSVQVNTQSAFTEAERLLKALKAGYQMDVVWHNHRGRVGGKASGATPDKIMRALKDLIKFRINYKSLFL